MLKTGAHFNSKAHSASLRFPKGLGLLVEQEVQTLLKSCYTPLKFQPEILRSANSVDINNIGLINLSELILRIKTAKDVILDLGSTRLQYKNEIAKVVKKLALQKLLPENIPIALRVSTSNSKLYHSGLIEEEFTKAFNAQKIEVGKKGKALTTLNITLKNNIVYFGISLSGTPLNYRNYREDLIHKAPLNECLAACCLQIAANIFPKEEQSKELDIHVPFAGSGTFGFEALLHFANIAPCIFRKEYVVEMLGLCSPASMLHTIKKSKGSISKNLIRLFFSDNDQSIINNLEVYSQSFLEKLAKKDFVIEVKDQDFFQSKIATTKNDICILINPPYGERLKTSEANFAKLAKEINSKYGKHKFKTWGVCLVPAGKPAEIFRKNLNSQRSESTKISNGGLKIEAISFLL